MQVCIKNSKYKPFYLFIVCCGLWTWRKEFILLILCEIFNWSFCINWEQSLNWILLCEISSAWKVFPTEWTIPFLNSFIYYVVHRIYIFSPFSNIKITFPIDRHQKLAQDSFSKAIHYSYNSTDPKWENQEQWMCNLCIHGTYYKYTALQWLWKIKGRKCSWFVVWCMQNWWSELLVQRPSIYMKGLYFLVTSAQLTQFCESSFIDVLLLHLFCRCLFLKNYNWCWYLETFNSVTEYLQGGPSHYTTLLLF